MTVTLQKKMCMLGGFSVGKTSLVRRFLHSVFSDTYLTACPLALLDRSSLTTAQRHLVETGLLAGDSLMGLLNDILDLSRMQVGRLSLRPAPFLLRPLLGHRRAALRERCRRLLPAGPVDINATAWAASART